MRRKNILMKVLSRHGVEDAAKYLMTLRGKNAGLRQSTDPDVRMRGNVQLMKHRTKSRVDTERELSELKYL